MSAMPAKESAPTAVPTTKPAAPAQDFNALLKRAAKGGEDCLSEIRALLADGERGRLLRDNNGSSAEWLRRNIAEKASGGNVLIREAIRQKLDDVRTELEGPNPTPIERLLAERASICWYLLYRYERAYFYADDCTIRQADYQQRKIDKAHARFLSALLTLARIRKLALPTLQLNFAENQVNVAGAGP